MRIISGKYGGRRFDLKIPPETRPTTDFVKEIVFNVLRNLTDFEGKIIYDVFAGTGAYGFEALSRGAVFCCFVDKSNKSINIIKTIIEKLNLPENQFFIIQKDAFQFFKNLSAYPIEKPDIIFIDAPYEMKLENSLLDLIKSSNTYKNSSIIVVEHSKMLKITPPPGFEIIKSRETGESIIDFIYCRL